MFVEAGLTFGWEWLVVVNATTGSPIDACVSVDTEQGWATVWDRDNGVVKMITGNFALTIRHDAPIDVVARLSTILREGGDDPGPLKSSSWEDWLRRSSDLIEEQARRGR